jgi:7,8-dihydro-6-hydroxymethylpterin-pyrophosphokinase
MIDGMVAICTSWIILPRLKVPVRKFLSRQFVLTVLGDFDRPDFIQTLLSGTDILKEGVKNS